VGILPANVLRSYWWRFNGWGYAAGVFGGMLLSLGQVIGSNDLWRTPLPLHVGVPVIAPASTVISIVVALLTKSTDEPTLAHFYQTVQPAGAWDWVKASVLSANPQFRRETPFSRDTLNTLLALVAIYALYVGTLYSILDRYGIACACFSTTLAMAVVLYFTWYRNLPAPEQTMAEEKVSASPCG